MSRLITEHVKKGESQVYQKNLLIIFKEGLFSNEDVLLDDHEYKYEKSVRLRLIKVTLKSVKSSYRLASQMNRFYSVLFV